MAGSTMPGAGTDAAETWADELVATVHDLLSRHPEALVAAIAGESSPRLVPVPAGLLGPSHRVVDDEKSIELVAPGDRIVVPRLWGRARTQGLAGAPLHLADQPEHLSHLYVFDLSSTHAVVLGVITDDADAAIDGLLRAAALPELAPRLAYVTKDPAAVLLEVTPELTHVLGWTADELVGRRMTELVHPDDLERAIASWLELLGRPGVGARVRLRHRHRDGSWVWMEVTNHNRLDDPDHGDVLAEMIDVNEEMAAHEALRAREQLLAQLTETVPLGLFHIDLAGALRFANRRFFDITSASEGADLCTHLGASMSKGAATLEAAVSAARQGLGSDVELTFDTTPEGTAARHCTLSLRPLFDDDGTVVGVTGSLEDITDRILARRELEVRAATDPLTGCLNRTAALSVLQDLLDDSLPGAATAVVFVDLDRFKPVNDVLGHAVGDELLVAVAQRVMGAVRSSDIVGRLGGDEFVVVCPGVASPADALRIAHFIAGQLCGPLELRSGMVDVRASFGVAWCDTPGTPAAHVIDLADLAMYRSKRDGLCQPVLSPA